MKIIAVGINLTSFGVSKEMIQKGKEVVKIPKKEFIDEHEKLVDVLDSESHEDDKKESKEQKRSYSKLKNQKTWIISYQVQFQKMN